MKSPLLHAGVLFCGLAGMTAEPPAFRFIQNDAVQIGVDLERGGCIGYFGPAHPARNFLNHYDEGRYLQQSWYGDVDGSDWNGKPWRYNPVQGGGWQGQKARVLDFDAGEQRLRIVTRPCHWATGKALPEMTMESDIRLEGPLARIRFSMHYTGPSHEKPRHQEMPALFVDATFQHLVHPSADPAKAFDRRIPGWPNEAGRSPEEWVAFVDDSDVGIGMLTPGTPAFTTYRFQGNGTTGPRGSACSYIAPVRTIALTQGTRATYEVFLTTGTLAEIAERFRGVKKD